jgi:hypothetical protein
MLNELDLVKGSGPRVYIVLAGRLHWVQDPESLGYVGGWGRVQVLPDAVLAATPEDPQPLPLLHEGTIVRAPDADPVYLLRGQAKHWVQCPQDLAELNGAVQPLAGPVIANIPDAAPISRGVHVQAEADIDGTGHLMRSIANLHADGTQVQVDTTTWCTNWVIGFTGGAVLLALDASGRVIGASELHPFGIDAVSVFWKPHSRSDHWTWDVPAGTADLKILHQSAERNRFAEQFAAVKQALDQAAAVYQYLTEFCRQHPELCALISRTVAV